MCTSNNIDFSRPGIIFNDNLLYSLVHFRNEVINALAKEGYRICLVAPFKRKNPTFDYIDKSVGIKTLPLDRTSVSIKNVFYYIRDLYRIINTENPGIIFNYTILPILFGGLVAKFKSVKSVAIFAGLNSNISFHLENKSLRSTIIRKILRTLLSFNKNIVFLNEEDLNRFKNANMLRPSQGILLGGGEGVDLIKYSSQFQNLQIQKDRYKVMMIGRILKTKGYFEFEECAKKCKLQNLPIDFIIAGGVDENHPDMIPLDRIMKAQEEGLFEFKGHILNLKEFMEDADCVILPSYYNEGMNRSLMEALSMGIPIITTDNRGCRELVINGETGYIIPPRNADALFEAVNTFINLPDSEKTAMKRASRRYAEERFDIKNVITAYKKLINN